jgi:hypothetical protein
VTLSDEVPGVITSVSLNPAGTHRGKAIVDNLIAGKQAGEPLEDVVWDPGASLWKPGTVHHKLAQAGIHQTFQRVTHQHPTVLRRHAVDRRAALLQPAAARAQMACGPPMSVAVAS